MDRSDIAQFNAQQVEDMLNVQRDNIDTKELSIQILAELTGRKISQELFAARIINRSQGTLSDLLGKPKPWRSLQAGRKTYTRLYNWMAQPLQTRMIILYGEPVGEINVPVLSQPQRKQNKRKVPSDQGEDTSKKPRLVFTDIQKRTLDSVFAESQRPNTEMQQMIADHLRLDVNTVYNYFVNARRRSRAAQAAQEQYSLQ